MILTKKETSKSISKMVCVVLPVVVIAFFIVLLVGNRFRRMADLQELTQLLEALEVNEGGNRMYNSEQERLSYLDTLRQYQSKVSMIAEKDSLISLFIGESSDLRERISHTQQVLSNQEKRYSRLNPLDTTTYVISSSERVDSIIHLITPDNLKLPVLNVAYVLQDMPASTKASALIILNDTDTLFCRYFEAQAGVNAFIFPNMFHQGVELRLGYITSQDGINTFHYVNYIPYE